MRIRSILTRTVRGAVASALLFFSRDHTSIARLEKAGRSARTLCASVAHSSRGLECIIETRRPRSFGAADAMSRGKCDVTRSKRGKFKVTAMLV